MQRPTPYSAFLSWCSPSYVRRLRTLVILLGGLALAACETVVDVELPDQPARLVANAFLEAGQPVSVELSQSQSILANANVRSVSDATLTLLEEGQAVTTIEESETAGVYFSSFRPSVGRTYTLQASHPGFESVEAVTVIRPPVAIQQIAYDTVVFRNTYDNGDSVVVEEYVDVEEVRITFDDPANERNYYEVEAYTYEAYPEFTYDEEGNPVVIDTVVSYNPQYLNSDDPVFSGEEGDFLGDEGEIYGETLSFSDELLNGKTYTLRFDPGTNFGGGQINRQLIVMLRSISEEQYRYFRSADLQYENDGNPFAEPVQVYSNVENGYGIFTGSSADSVVFEME